MALQQRHLRQFISTSSLLSLARVAGAAAGFATQILLARTLQASALGIFYSVISLAAVMGVVAALGYPEIASRFASRYRDKGPKGLLPAFVNHARTSTAVCAAIATVAVLAFAAFWPGIALEARLATAAAAIAILANAALRFNGALAASFRKFELAYLPDTSIWPFLWLACLLLLVALGTPLTALLAIALLTLIFIVLAVVQYRLLLRAVPQTEERTGQASLRFVRIWRGEAPPLILVALYMFFFADVDILWSRRLCPARKRRSSACA